MRRSAGLGLIALLAFATRLPPAGEAEACQERFRSTIAVGPSRLDPESPPSPILQVIEDLPSEPPLPASGCGPVCSDFGLEEGQRLTFEGVSQDNLLGIMGRPPPTTGELLTAFWLQGERDKEGRLVVEMDGGIFTLAFWIVGVSPSGLVTAPRLYDLCEDFGRGCL